MVPPFEPRSGVDVPDAPAAAPVRSDDLQRLAASVSASSRVSVRLRRDRLFEVSTASGVIGFVEYAGPVFVALKGTRPSRAVEVAQHLSLAAAVEQLRQADAR